ncbi:MAG: lytic transglycosylase domain-containing protein, partial [Actinomycetota bacterium]
MGLVLRAVSGGIVAACALSLSGAAVLPATVRTGEWSPRVASVTEVATRDEWGAQAASTAVTAEIVAEPDRSEVDGGALATDDSLSIEPDLRDIAVPSVVLEAYRAAAAQLAEEMPSCGLRWEILAGIGKVESNHASGGQLNADGAASPRIIGPVLNGDGPTAAIADSDGGEWDGDAVWDRAVGPMQFIPGTWRGFGVDGSGDGVADPQNVWDATLSAGYYLCAGGADLSSDVGLRSALLRYNRSTTYVSTVIGWINAYADGSIYATDDGAGDGTSEGIAAPSRTPSPEEPRVENPGKTPEEPSKQKKSGSNDESAGSKNPPRDPDDDAKTKP